MSEQLGLTECVSMALGGMIGGGIYAVLGVVAGVTDAATWFAFLLAGAVALCAGYSYNKLNVLVDDGGGSVSFVQSLVGNTTLAGMLGWTLLFGYVGSMAMYAFAFAEFTLGFSVVPAAVFGLPMRPLVSVAAVALFVALNLLGARTTGTAENVLVAAKVLVLVAFGVFGLVYATSLSETQMAYGFGQLTTVGPVVAAAISFVAFQGWQLLFYDQDSVSDHVETIRRAVYISIPAAVAIYVLVAVVTVNLAPQALEHHPHVALADAASEMLSVVGLSSLGFVVVSVSALFSTGSAINATLFSAAHFAKRLIRGDLLPDRFGDTDADGAPEKAILALGVVTAAFASYGSLGAITSFASLSFIVVFGAMSLLAFRNRDAADADINPVLPAVGTVGALGFAPLMVNNLYNREPGTFWMVVVLAVLTVAVELLYFERDTIQHQLGEFEDDIESRM
ncbi:MULTISPECIES: APC family permease [Halobacterium]|uniref:APC family permease n=1 Tax=Halobacterium TaxID=2239 RepID=UPI00073F2F3B|nr:MULTISPECIES: APC family permease [Halobacterium]MCG1002219.1 APC family permease [Halobacterium noricense]